MKTISVEVLRKHIKKGKKGSYSYCPIALALREAGHKRVRVNMEIFLRSEGLPVRATASSVGFYDEFRFW